MVYRMDLELHPVPLTKGHLFHREQENLFKKIRVLKERVCRLLRSGIGP